VPTIEAFVRKVVTARPQSSLRDVACLMEQHNVGAVVIVEGQRPVGIITDRDLALALGAQGMNAETPAVRLMSTPVTIVQNRDGVFDITQTIRENKVRRLPVVDEDGCLVGIVTVDDLFRVLGRETMNVLDGIAEETSLR
jgi:CBS domain-containing protein